MKKTALSAVAVALALALMSGCVTRLGAFSVISTKNIDWSRASEFRRSANRVEGSDMLQIIIVIPTKFAVTPAEAIDQALEKVPGAVALVDAVLSTSTFYIPYIYGKSGYIVEGGLLIDPSLAKLEGKGNYLLSYSNDGKEFTASYVSKEEFDSFRKNVAADRI